MTPMDTIQLFLVKTYTGITFTQSRVASPLFPFIFVVTNGKKRSGNARLAFGHHFVATHPTPTLPPCSIGYISKNQLLQQQLAIYSVKAILQEICKSCKYFSCNTCKISHYRSCCKSCTKNEAFLVRYKNLARILQDKIAK